MTPTDFLRSTLLPGLETFEGVTHIPSPLAARQLLLTIALQESGLTARRQIGGPARGWWQFEGAHGATGGVLLGFRTAPYAQALCAHLTIPIGIPIDVALVFEAIAWSDPLAVGFARLLLWSDPTPLPPATDAHSGWQYYLRNWRPGKPRPDAWSTNHALAAAALQGVD